MGTQERRAWSGPGARVGGRWNQVSARVDPKTREMHRTGQKVNPTVASWRTGSVALNLPATHLTGENSYSLLQVSLHIFQQPFDNLVKDTSEKS